MKRTLLLCLLSIVSATLAWAAAVRPIISTADKVVWYYIVFTNQNNLLTAQGDGAKVLTGAYMGGTSEQLWKLEGDATAGYTLTNQAGRVLYVDNPVQSSGSSGFFYASTKPSKSYTKFDLVDAADGNSLLIAPHGKRTIFMNQFGGAGEGKTLGLWTGTGDAGSALTFMESAGTAPRIVPAPAQMTLGDGSLSLSALTAITYPTDSAKVLVEEFVAQLQLTSGIKLTAEPTADTRKAGAINLAVDATLPAEGYKFVADKDGISIVAAKQAGFFYAIQTLKQLLPNAFFGKSLHADAAWQVPYVNIEDAPRFGHRGYMLDIARHFFDKNEVKRILDILSFYKLNRFHWHLSDDQGWRIEIPEYPKLTTVGAVRSGSFVNAGGSSKFFDDTEYGRGMFYTLADLREIVDYAKARNIEIIPEIDLPGHMVAAITAYPNLSCDSTKTYSVRLDGGISRNVLNVGSDKVVDFLKCVLGHVAETFPYKYVHIGGDECPTDEWKTNEDCLRRVREEKLAGVHELQSWLVEVLGTFLKEKYGKDIVVWDELLAHWQADNTVKPVIMAWNSIGMSAQAANKGFKSIVVPYQSLYLDMMQVPVSQTRADELYQGGWGDGFVNSLPTVYSVNPVSQLSGREDYCLGVQGNMWTETCNNSVQLEYQLLPRLLALSEIGWLPAEKKNYLSFLTRLQEHAPIFDSLQYTYAKHYIFSTDKTAADSAITEAAALLKASQPGSVGHVNAEVHTALQTAFDALKADRTQSERLTALTAAIADFKAADIVLPEEGKIYQLVSAATYYKQLYNGSTAYESDGAVRFHYTPQTEPEELWQFVKEGNGYKLRNYLTGHTVSLPTYNADVSAGTAATTLRIDKATIPYKECTAMPGAVVISAVDGYAATATGNVKRLFADCTGYVKAFNQPTLTYAGTWRIVEVTDYTAQLRGLLTKCEKELEEAVVGQYGQPTQEALDYLRDNVIAPIREALKASVDEAVYKQFLALYTQYLAMPRTELYDSLDEGFYYRIRPDYASFSSYYCKADNASKRVVPAALKQGDDSYLWCIVKQGSGKVRIFSKGTGLATYVGSMTDATQIALGTAKQATSWYLSYNNTPEAKGINIGNGTLSWYTNPNSFKTIILKPVDWGGSMWVFERTAEEVPTGIVHIGTDENSSEAQGLYDLTGRRVSTPERGVYITADGRKLLK